MQFALAQIMTRTQGVQWLLLQTFCTLLQALTTPLVASSAVYAMTLA